MSVIVYTAILGDCDSLKPAPKGADDCLCFVDNIVGVKTPVREGWRLIPTMWSEPRRAAWQIRSRAHESLKKYVESHEVSVWADASFTITDLPRLLRDSEGHLLSALQHHKRKDCYEEGIEVARIGQSEAFDVGHQLGGYRAEGFKPTSLSISCILVRRNNPRVNAFNELWDSEIRKHPGDNTQLSLDYCAWKTGIGVHHLEGTRHDNPYAVHDHKDHKHRRKPYR